MLSLPLHTRASRAAAVAAAGVIALAAYGIASAPQGGGTQPPAPASTVFAGGATADSNHRMIAVTGVDVTGASILYLVDTERMRLAVYQASGGSASTQGVRLVGARRIDLDLELDGFNDRSEFSYQKLRDEFEKQGLLAPPAPSGDGH
jgi:hypothetical protein